MLSWQFPAKSPHMPICTAPARKNQIDDLDQIRFYGKHLGRVSLRQSYQAGENEMADGLAAHLAQFDAEAARHSLRMVMTHADDGEVFVESRRAEGLSFDDGRLKTASHDASIGFGLRLVQADFVGHAHSDQLDLAAVQRAAAAAAGGLSRTHSARPLVSTDLRPPHAAPLYMQDDPQARGPDFPARVALLAEIDAWLRAADPKVQQVSISLAYSRQSVMIIRPDGPVLQESRPMARLNIAVTVQRGDRRESGSAGQGGRHELALLTNHWQPLARLALERALQNLEAEEAPAGVMDVVLGPGWPGVLLHEAVGHGLEGDFIRKGTSAFAGLLGQRVAAPGVTVVDDGTWRDRRGSLTFDDEGTPTGCTTLIEDGILVGFMHDRQSARAMGVPPTGNGRRESCAHLPMPRMTNTYMQPGTLAPADVVAALSNGIHATGFSGGQVDITNGKFVFNCTEAWRVKGGRRLHPIKGATLIGDGPSALQRIRAVGNDLALDPGIGNCGKAGQWVPVGVGQPSLLIAGLTVGGRGQ